MLVRRGKPIISFLRIKWSLFEKILVFFTQGCLVSSWTESGSGEEDFKTCFMYFNHFIIIFSWTRVWPFIWTNLNPLHPRMLLPSWLKLAQGFWRRRFINFSMYFCLFIIISPWKKIWSFIWTNLNSSHSRILKVSSLGDIGPVVLGKNIKMWKVYRWMDNRQYAIIIFHMSFKLREIKTIYFQA